MFLLGLCIASQASVRAGVVSELHGRLPDGRVVKSFTLTNQAGVKVTLLSYGALVAAISTPDRQGKHADITLGNDALAGWLANDTYMGATIGRYANRIAQGGFELEGRAYQLETNNAPGGMPCHLHGGKEGFNRKLWSAKVAEQAGAGAVEFSYTSAHGEEGYPGQLEARVTYTLTEQSELRIAYEATTDRLTIVNLTNHTYWNLTGDPTQTILGHRLTLAADEMLPVNAGLIPTGQRSSVKASPFDFTREKAVGESIDAKDRQLEFGGGYDHCWVLRQGEGVRLAARIYEPGSGRVLELFTDQPGLQFYSGNFLDGSVKGKGGVSYQWRTGLCLEPGNFPDAPNRPEFPSAALMPGQVYRHTTVLKFSVQ